MAFQVSPGINVSEIDLTTVVPADITNEGAISGVFNWGPLKEVVLISSEDELVRTFGRPANNNFETFFTAANFLAYSNALYVVRVAETGNANTDLNAYNASAVANNDFYVDEDAFAAETATPFVAKYVGSLGNSLDVSICYDSIGFTSTPDANLAIVAPDVNTSVYGVTTAQFDANTTVEVGDIVRIGPVNGQYQEVEITEVGSNNDITFAPKYRFATPFSGSVSVYWKHKNLVDAAPTANNLHVVVIDRGGKFTGTAGTILEVYENVSRDITGKTEDGSTNYYKNVIDNASRYIHSTGATLTTTGTDYLVFRNGADGAAEWSDVDEDNAISLAKLAEGYDIFASDDLLEISFVLQGKARNDHVLANYIIDNVAESRRDCVAFISPRKSDVVGVLDPLTNILNYRANITSSSYAVMDSGYKYQFDKYNDVYRWIPLNGDIAGLCARTDDDRDPWYSPAGYNRGIIKNVVKLAYTPRKADRDQLYRDGINPVITQSGEGTLLFGDKTLLARSSAFNRINVRRLFITLEKLISRASRSTLFEFNDAFTRAQFRNLVEPFLRDVQGRRGITDFRVVCDETNNTAEVIDRNEFRGDIYIKPARSINFIQLNFVAVRTGVEFSEIVGEFG